MKLLIVIAATLLVVNANEEHLKKLERAEQVAKDCVTEVGVDEAVATQLKNADFSNRSDKAECFVKCLYEKIGFMDKDGNIFKEVFLKTAQGDAEKKKAAEDLINKCISVTNENKCGLAYDIFQCYWTARKTSLAEEFKRVKEALATPAPADNNVPVPPAVAAAA